MNGIDSNITAIRGRIKQAALNAGRNPSEIKLMAVTKTVVDDRILEAIASGVELIGENYIQEARRKHDVIGARAQFHFIGHLQTNKAKYAVQLFTLIHSVDRIELAEELNKKAASIGKTQNILIEVNTSGEASKSGIAPVATLPLIKEISPLTNLRICGLMTMPPYFDNPEDARKFFISLRELRDEIATQNINNVFIDELSMGMSDDFEVAIEEGATIIRIGRGIFGDRPVKV